MWWPYIQSVINMDFINKCIIVISQVCKVYLFNDGLTCVLVILQNNNKIPGTCIKIIASHTLFLTSN